MPRALKGRTEHEEMLKYLPVNTNSDCLKVLNEYASFILYFTQGVRKIKSVDSSWASAYCEGVIDFLDVLLHEQVQAGTNVSPVFSV